MISCTLGNWPIRNTLNIQSERFQLSSSPILSSASTDSKSATRVCTKNSTGVSFAASPEGSRSIPVFQTTGRHLRWFGNRGRLRSYGSASQDCLWCVQRALLHTGEKQLLDGFCRSSRSQEGTHLFELDWRGVTFCGPDESRVTKREYKRLQVVRSSRADAESDNDYCDRLHDQPYGACSFRRSSSPTTREGTNYVEVPEGSDPDQAGYTIKVSKELMGVFRYVEKVKRARIKELADTLRQTAGACMFFSCVRGVLGPLVEVFQTRPPSWGRLILMLSAFDSFAITYLALKASEPLQKLSVLASESEKDIMGSIEKEEEHMLALAVELVKLFRRLRNITVCTAVAQFASLVHSLLRLNNPKLVANIGKVVRAWLNIPWH